MGRVHRVRGGIGIAPGALAAIGALAVVLAGCSGGHHTASAPPSTTSTTGVPGAPTTLLSPATTTGPGVTVPAPSTAPGTTAPEATAPGPTAPATQPGTTSPGGGHVSIDGFDVSPGSPVTCSAPTSVELKWTSSGAPTVGLAIDGSTIATYGPGPQDHLAYLPCDGKAHTYTLTAESGGAHATTSRTVSTQRS